MPKTSHPKRGSLKFTPRNRAKRFISTIKVWGQKEGASCLGFAGYKAGSAHVIALARHPRLIKQFVEKSTMVTVIDAPPMKVVGLRFYAQTGDGGRPIGEIWHDPLPKELARRIRLPGKSAKTEAETDAIKKAASRISLIVCTQPHLAGFGKKNPEIMECAVAGDTTDAQFKTAKDFLGREIRARDVLVAGDFVDVFAVSKGKGFQGPVKRFGVAIQKNPNKVKKAARKVATIGQFRPGRTFWTVPMPGQMGCHQHCELNKQVMKLGESGFVRPGGWKHYGTVPGDYILIAGSVPGPAKRLIRFRFAVRKKEPAEKPNIVTVVGEAK